MTVRVQDKDQRLEVIFVEDDLETVWEGELSKISLRIENTGSKPLQEIWLVAGPDDHIWLESSSSEYLREIHPTTSHTGTASESSSQWNGSSHWSNTIRFSDPLPIPIEEMLGSASISPSQSIDLPLCLHAVRSGDQHLRVLVVYREVIIINTQLPPLTVHLTFI